MSVVFVRSGMVTFGLLIAAFLYATQGEHHTPSSAEIGNMKRMLIVQPAE